MRTTTRADVRTLDPADLVGWCAVLNHAFFLPHDPAASAEVRRGGLDFDRTLAGYADGQVVSTFRSFPTPLTLPGGGVLTADAITAVTVSATHRRQGLLTEMMTTDLRAARDRGEPVAILIASEWSIYGRFGFGAATEHAEYELDARSARFVDGGAGTVAYSTADEMRALAPAVFDAHRLTSVSEIGRTDRTWDVTFGQLTAPWSDHSKDVHVLCRDDDGQTSGYATFTIEDRWDGRRPNVLLTLREMVTTHQAAATRLWRFLCDIDLVMTVKAADRSVAEPLRWQLGNARALHQRDRADFQWVRLLDVPTALAARRYPAPGRVVLEVVDGLGMSGGRYELEGSPDGAECRPTTRSADLSLDVRELGAVYLGGAGLQELATAGLVIERSSGALAGADAMFRGAMSPWSATWY
ncbi:MAG: GNAT family N-acetyltransferase [Frankiaceae bacterium]